MKMQIVSWSSDNQGDQFFNTDENNFYLAVDTDNTLPGVESDEMCIYFTINILGCYIYHTVYLHSNTRALMIHM